VPAGRAQQAGYDAADAPEADDGDGPTIRVSFNASNHTRQISKHVF
jgi:hypothetical protein